MTAQVDLRIKILTEAATLFVVSGYHAVSMREIAATVGASKAAIYYHFADKEALLLAIMEQSLAHLVEIVQAATRQSDTEAALHQVVHGLLGLDSVQRAAMRLAMFELQHLSADARRRFAQRYHQEFIGGIQHILHRGQVAGVIRSGDLATTTWALLGLLYPFSLTPSRSQDTASVSQTIVTLFLDGVRNHG
jgi:AcrR family transcriptional regulator